MKSYEEIAQIGTGEIQMRLAEEALNNYGLGGAELVLLSDTEHAIFRVMVPAGSACAVHPYLGRIAGEQFVLRVHQESQSFAELYSEMVYLLALCRDTELMVPEPVPSLRGDLIVALKKENSISESRLCVLLRWVEDEGEYRDLTSQRLAKVGALITSPHNHTDSFMPPVGFANPKLHQGRRYSAASWITTPEIAEGISNRSWLTVSL